MNKTDRDLAYEDWIKFQNDIKKNNRFFTSKEFVVNLEKVIKLHKNKLKKSTELFRARINGIDNQHNKYNCSEMILSDFYNIFSGRANPAGISYLYTSLYELTCLKEVRAQKWQEITVGKFKSINDMKIIDFVNPSKVAYDEYINCLSVFLNSSFSQPLLYGKPEIEYTPYQFICEFIKIKGFDGVLYKSSFASESNKKNSNLVIFDENNVQCVGTKRVLITKADFYLEYNDCDKFT